MDHLKNRNLALLALLFVMFSMSYCLADIPVDYNAERKGWEADLTYQLKGLNQAKKIAKVQALKKEAEREKESAQMNVDNPPEGGMPAYMYGKQVASQSRRINFYQEWLDKALKKGSASPSKSSSPVTPGLFLGWIFLAAALILGSKRFLSHQLAPQH